LSDKDFKVKNKLQVKGITSAGPVVSDASGNLDSTAYIATQYGGTGTSTSPTSGQILYSASGTSYAPTTLTSLVAPVTYSTDAPSSPVTGQVWIESDSLSDSFDPNIIRRQAFTATAGQTVFTTAIAFIDGYEQVYFNGLLLLRTTDYTTSNSNTITLVSAAAANDIVEVVTVTNLNSVNTYTQAEIDSALSAKLSTSTAASTYLTQSNASSTYLTQSSASSTYLTSSTASSTYLTQTNAASTYVPQAGYNVAGKNKIINGDFAIWQRGTSFTLSTGVSTFGPDRWHWIMPGGTVVSRQPFTAGSAPVAGYEGQYYVNTTINTNGQYYEANQKVEDARTFAGQTVTLSFWARSTVGAQSMNTLMSQNFGTGGSPSSAAFASLVTSSTGTATYTPTSTWTRYWFTYSLPSVSGKTFGTNNDSFLLVRPLQFLSTNTNTSIDIWGVQLEAGSQVTPFNTATPNQQTELAACQRYYYRETKPATGSALIGPAYARTTGIAFATWTFPVTMRATPTLAFSNATQDFNLQIAGGDATFNTLSGSSLASATRASLRADAGTHTIGQAGVLGFNGANAWIEASAEL
jgi:hypothetical protein